MSKRKPGRSAARASTSSSRTKAGAKSEPSRSEIESLDPVEWLWLERPELWKGTRKLLSERSFVRIFIEEQRTQAEQMARYGISYGVLTRCRKLYGPLYASQLKMLRSRNHSRAMRGNRHGRASKGIKRPHKIKTLLPRDKLEALVRQGLKDVEIARRLKTTEYHVRRNIKHYEIQRDFLLPPKLQHLSTAEVARLEALAPGFTEAAQRFYEEPEAFFNTIYQAMTGLVTLVDELRSFAPSHAYYVRAGLIPKSHVCWSLNRAEMLLSRALLDAGVPHQREFCFFKNWRADFFFPPDRLLVEVDGEFHRKDKTTKARDRRKTAKAKELGYRLLRFTTDEVTQETGRVVSEIEAVTPRSK